MDSAAATTDLAPLEQNVLERIEEARPRVVEVLKTLIAFDTTNPPGLNEAQAQAWIATQLMALGLTVETFDALPGRPDVVGWLKGSDPHGRSLLFNGHVDVAELRTPDAWSYPPFAAVEQDGRVYGLGSSDMKSAHAGFLVMLECLNAAGVTLLGDLIYESVIGEEAGEPGTAACVDRGVTADFAIVGECTRGESVVVTSVGAINMAVTLRDPSTYHLIQRRQRPDRSPLIGSNCIEKMSTLVIPALLELERLWAATKRHPRLPANQAMINVFSIEGGGNTFIIPNECRAMFTVVYLPDDDLDQVKAEIEHHLQARTRDDEWFAAHPLEVEWNPPDARVRFEPIDTSPEHPGVALLSQCLNRASGRAPVVTGRDAIMDGGWLFQAGIPTVVFGPGDKTVIHAPDEYVAIDDVIAFAKTCALFVLRWCRTSNGEVGDHGRA
jgi:acetylornithine deacetylase/succinyl-diaminopimelate desuccinylase family protein